MSTETGGWRVLLVEDDPLDADVLARLLARKLHGGQLLRVDQQPTLRNALESTSWDVVISDYHLPGFGALQALSVVQQVCPDLPFVVFSGMIGEEAATELMRSGAHDYVMKDRPARLLPAVEREIREGRRRVQQRRQDALMRRQQAQYALALQVSGDGMWDWNPPTGAANFSPECLQMLGLPEAEEARWTRIDAWRERIHPADLAQVMHAQAEHFAERTRSYRSEHRLRTASGDWLWVLDRGVVVERDEAGLPLREIGTMTDITPIRRISAELRASHELLSKLSAQVPGVLYQFQRMADGRYSFPYASAGVEQALGMTAEQLRRLPWDACVHPLDRPELHASTARSARTLQRWSLRFRIQHPQLGLRWVHAESQPELQQDGSVVWHGFARDITELQMVGEELRLLHASIDHVHDVVKVMEVDPHQPEVLRVRYVNAAGLQELGRPSADVLGQLPLFLRPDGGAVLDREALLQALREGRDLRLELQVPTAAGALRWAEIHLTPLRLQDEHVTHWISVQRDIDARKRAEEERIRLIAELETRNAQLDAYNHSVAHDLRNPVLSIRGLADLLDIALEQGSRDRAGAYLDKIVLCAEQADALIKSLMTLAKLGQQALQPAPIRMHDWMRGLLVELDHLIVGLQAEIHTRFAPELVIVVDESVLRVVLVNLVGNALKHRHPQRAPSVVIELHIDSAATWVDIRVHDNGRGIPRTRFQDVFLPFERLDARSEGMGVGLALVQRAVELHGGKVQLESSQPDIGSCFWVRLPLGKCPGHPHGKHPS